MVAIKGHKLQQFITSQLVSSMFLQTQDEISGVINQSFLQWEQQDQLLASRLLSSMSESILMGMVGCDSAFQIWQTLEKYFVSQTRAKVSQLKDQLKAIKKDNLTLNECLLKIKHIVNLLSLVGHVLSNKDHIEAIFEGLSSEYDSFIVSVTQDQIHFLLKIMSLQSLPLAQETRIEKHHKNLD